MEPAAAKMVLQNTASVSSATPDPNPQGKLSDSTTIGVGEIANLALAKSVSPQMANVGELVTYTFAVTNNVSIGETGGEPSRLSTTGAHVTDTLPEGLRFVGSALGSSCSATPGPAATVTCNLGAVAPGQNATASFVAEVTPPAAGTMVENIASVASVAAGGFSALAQLEPANETSRASEVVKPLADLSLSKTVSDANPRVDDEVDYRLTATNAGPNEATGVIITDSLPAGLDFIDASPGCDNNNGTVTCELGTIATGGATSVTIRARTTAVIAGMSVDNLATVDGEDVPQPATARAAIEVQPLVDLRLTKTASDTSPTAGGPVTYTLALINNGPSPASGATITDPLPNGLSFVSATTGQGHCEAVAQTVLCQVETLAAGGSALVAVTAEVAPSAAGSTIVNTASASSNELTRFPDLIARPELLAAEAAIRPLALPATPPAAPTPPTAQPPPTAPALITPVAPTSTPAAGADLAVLKTVDHAKSRVGEELTYAITVANNGPATAASPTVTDTFSAPVNILALRAPEGSCSKGTASVCHLNSLASGASARITLIARLTRTGDLRNSASVTSPTPDPDQANNLAHVTTDVGPGAAALSIVDRAGRRIVHPDEVFPFTITVRSLGPEPALAVEVCDRLGSGMTFISVHQASLHTEDPCWKIRSLAKGKQRRFVVWARAQRPAGPRVPTGPRVLMDTATASAERVHARDARALVRLTGRPHTRSPAVTG